MNKSALFTRWFVAAFFGVSCSSTDTDVASSGCAEGQCAATEDLQMLIQSRVKIATSNEEVAKASTGAPKFWFQSKFPEPKYYLDEPFVQGPTQIDDLGFIFGIIKELRPKTLVEIGAYKGDSAKVFLSACDDDSKLFSFDPYPQAEIYELQTLIPTVNYAFFPKSGENLTQADLEGRKVDFAFIDASHVLESNQRIWHALVPQLAENAVVAIHDTGFWSKEYLDKFHADDYWRPGQALGKGNEKYFLHRNHIDERRFVNWITDKFPDYEAMNFHTFRYLRNGVTLVQKKSKLEVPTADFIEQDAGLEVGTIADGCSNFQGASIICEIEKPEHHLVSNWVTPEATVLEFGARFGTTTCEIAKQIKNSGKLVAVEPDASVWFDLHQNLASNKCDAHVLQGVVSNQPLFLPGLTNTFYNLRTATDQSGVAVPNLRFDHVQQMLALKFDTLLIDCEGCLPNLMEHFGNKIPDQIHTILLEGDMPQGAPDCTENCVDYAKYIQVMKDNGFHVVEEFNDCDRSRFGGSEQVWCGNWIQHYALKRGHTSSKTSTIKAHEGSGKGEGSKHTVMAEMDEGNDKGKGKSSQPFKGKGSKPYTVMAEMDEGNDKGKGKSSQPFKGKGSKPYTVMAEMDEGNDKGKGKSSQPFKGKSRKPYTVLSETGERTVRDTNLNDFKGKSMSHLSIPYATSWQASVEIVAAHFDEDLSWTSLYSSPRVKFTIYSKSPTPPPGTLPLPNVGREGQTYLHHIVANYDNLAPWTVFTQATRPAWGYFGPGQQSGHLSDNVIFDDYLRPFPEGKDSFFVFDCVVNYPTGLALMRTGFLVSDIKEEFMQKDICPSKDAGWSPWWYDEAEKQRRIGGMGMSQFYSAYIAQDGGDGSQPLTLAFAQSGRFAVSRARIHLRPREYYEALLQVMSSDVNPIEGYWLESSWYDVFHPEALQSMSPTCDYPAPPQDITSAITVPNLVSTVRAIAETQNLLDKSADEVK